MGSSYLRQIIDNAYQQREGLLGSLLLLIVHLAEEVCVAMGQLLDHIDRLNEGAKGGDEGLAECCTNERYNR